MEKGVKTKLVVFLNEKQLAFITEFAEKRFISKSEAIRIIIDMKRRSEEMKN